MQFMHIISIPILQWRPVFLHSKSDIYLYENLILCYIFPLSVVRQKM